MTLAVHPIGALTALAVAAIVIATIYWMLHPPSTKADVAAEQAEAALEQMVGSIIVVFAQELRSRPSGFPDRGTHRPGGV